MRSSRYPWSPSIAICAFSGWLGREDGISLSTVPGMTVVGCSAILAVSELSSAIFADLDIRGFAISARTPTSILLLVSFLCLLLFMDSFLRFRDEWLPFRFQMPSIGQHSKWNLVARAASKRQTAKARSDYRVQSLHKGHGRHALHRSEHDYSDTPDERLSGCGH